MLTFKGRKEDRRLVRGQGQYSSDWNLPGQLHACFLRADRAHAAIRSVDTAAAKRMAGVVAVLDGADLVGAGMHTLPPTMPYPGRDGARILMPERPALAHERVRYVGEEVVLVIAGTVRQAMDAADALTSTTTTCRPRQASIAPWRRAHRNYMRTSRATSASISTMVTKRPPRPRLHPRRISSG
jgi:xanthine dehydrogenase molybdopterin-binding subunit B